MVIHAEEKTTGEQPRRYNLPKWSEMEAIVPGMDNGQIGKRNIRMQRRIGNCARMEAFPLTQRSHDPLVYVILFPKGRDGWHLSMQRADRNKLTPLMFYSWRLFQISGIQRYYLWRASLSAVFGGSLLQDGLRASELA